MTALCLKVENWHRNGLLQSGCSTFIPHSHPSICIFSCNMKKPNWIKCLLFIIFSISPDYDCPVSESGELSPKWYAAKKLFQALLPEQVPEDLPEPPPTPKPHAYGNIMHMHMVNIHMVNIHKSDHIVVNICSWLTNSENEPTELALFNNQVHQEPHDRI